MAVDSEHTLTLRHPRVPATLRGVVAPVLEIHFLIELNLSYHLNHRS
jgi:hypothetical protein